MAKVEALGAFLAKKAEIDRLLARLAAASAEHFGVAPADVNWGHVGALEYQAEQLHRICAFALGAEAGR